MLRDRSLWPLSHQHHNGLALGVLIRRELDAGVPPQRIEELCRKAVDRFDIELTNHFFLEEQILFPAALPHLGGSPLMEELIAEHRRLEAMAAELREHASLDALVEFTGLLRAHIRREEDELFPAIQDAVPREVLDTVGQELDQKAVRVCL